MSNNSTACLFPFFIIVACSTEEINQIILSGYVDNQVFRSSLDLIMPFIPHTPESLLPRSDSKNPATTCKGITSTGRPCRRPLGTSPQASPTGKRKSQTGVVAVLQPSDENHEGAAAFFCWQHQDQGQSLASADQNGRRADLVQLQPRTSIDTLAERLGVLDIGEDGSVLQKKKRKHHTRPARKKTLPQKWQDVDGPLLAVSNKKHKTRQREAQHKSMTTSNFGFSLFCCGGAADVDPAPPPRVRRHTETRNHSNNESTEVRLSLHQPGPPISSRRRAPHTAIASDSGSPIVSHTARLDTHTGGRPNLSRDRPSQTQDLLSFIPRTLAPQTTSVLLAELAKPVSPHDEDGYIYMFWLTDAAAMTPDAGTASSLLSDKLPSAPNGRRKSDVLQTYVAQSGVNGSMSKPETILLKIGRASNVQRRMNEWTRQCGYNLSLVRFYPYVATSSRPSTSTTLATPTPQKVPHAHKAERLIHLELADQRVKRSCESCGKEHREWFVVNSSREGLRNVDEVIKRWVRWAQGVRAS